MKVSKEFKVGLLVVLGVLLLYAGVNFLKGTSLFMNDREFYAVFDNTNGLQASNQVQLNGLQIGQVSEVSLHPNNPQKILVKYVITDKDLLIPDGSEAWLISSDLLGTKALDLRLNMTPQIKPAYMESGDTIVAKVETGISEQISEELLPLKRKTEELIITVDGIVGSINSYWDTSASYTIDESLYELRNGISKFSDLAEALTVFVNDETQAIDKILVTTGNITENLANKSDKISKTIDNIASISDTLADVDIHSVVLETQQTLAELNEVLSKVNNGEGTLGALLHTDSLHNELIQTNQTLQDLLEDLESNPNKYVHFSVFGRKMKEEENSTNP